MPLVPLVQDSKILCSQCKSKQPRTGSIHVAIGKHHYRVVCSACNRANRYQKLDDYAEELYEERKMLREAGRVREP